MVDKDHLETTYNLIDEIIFANRLTEDSLENLGDLLIFLRDDILIFLNMKEKVPSESNEVDTLIEEAWAESIRRRLHFPLTAPTPFKVQYQQKLEEILPYWNKTVKPIELSFRFGQMRIAPHFAGGEKAQPPRIKMAAGQDIRTITRIRVTGQNTVPNNTPLAYGHAFPIEVFPYRDSTADKIYWVALNNRGLAAHCVANIQPRRIIPVKPTPEALKRLAEVEGKDYIGPLQFLDNQRPKKELPYPRTLPSAVIPITSGQQTWDVISIVHIPTNWN